ncbi:MAG: pilus assembly protein [Chloroflexi bacterium]|nr:pilus assembly protein [Chloroflexota bacterium]MBF6607005.1 pilus assembly protein [Chloroflexota bacterium]
MRHRSASDAHRRAGRSGQGLVEFALVVPVFLLMVFGIIDGGRFVYMSSVLSQAAREGARTGSVEASWLGKVDPSCGQPGGPTCPATAATLKADVLSAADRMVTPFANIVSSQMYISCDPPSTVPSGAWTSGTACTAGTGGTGVTGNVISVRVALTYQPLTPIVGQVIGPTTIYGSASMVIN